MNPTILLAIGVLLLWFGGEVFVRGSVAVARRFKVSQLMIGLTLVGFGTSLPELVTSVTAALDGAPGLAVGNVVGSNLANVLLILGAVAAIRPVVCDPEPFFRDAGALAVATAFATGLILFGHINRLSASILVLGLIVYIALVYRQERTKPGPAKDVLVGEAEIAETPLESLTVTTAMVIIGLASVVGGAWVLVSGATALAISWGVSRTFMGLTIVAIGTSLPELVISGVAAFRGRSDVALGNIMGSNMFNLLAILGLTSVVVPIDVPPELRLFDLATMVAATVVLIVMASTKLSISRLEGMLFLIAYMVYSGLRAHVAL